MLISLYELAKNYKLVDTLKYIHMLVDTLKYIHMLVHTMYREIFTRQNLIAIFMIKH